ncbi:START domain-containing protein [Caenorhabditis elegans]|nr:START domain-containing protein [Caenorhabditis elegans]CCA65566.1 START domain-containing protein [Caenorhabditis elegans]|eukprot:NP_001251251.1 Steroidogenic acute regulatory-like protein 1 [Caenorhabditis elegans]
MSEKTNPNLTLHDVTDKLEGDDEKYATALKTCGEVFAEVEAIFNDENYLSHAGWFKDESNNEGDVVYAKDTPHGRMVTISTELPMPVEDVMKETWNGMEALPEWNQNINFAARIAAPTSNFDIVTYGNNDVLVVSGREFVSARIWRKVGDGFILASRSVTVPSFKSKHKGKVRAHLHLAGARFRPNPENPETTLTDVVMLADLKGYLPKMIVNQVIGRIMIMDTVTNRRHFQNLKAKRTNN